jgi:hypothetical protein
MSRRTKIAAAAVLFLGLVGGPAALAAPAQAAVQKPACTVTPLTPKHTGFQSGKKIIDYRVQVHCKRERVVNIVQHRFEDDPFFNDYLGKKHWNNVAVGKDKTVTLSSKWLLGNHDPEGWEEVFHKVKFQEGIPGENFWSNWSGWSVSRNLSLPD